jgi:gliding motility-associated-like protein
MTKHLIILLLVALFFKFKAQTDTSFWFVAPDISNTMGEQPIVFRFETYAQPSIVYIRQPALTGTPAINTSISIGANSVYTLDVSAYIPLNVVESAPVNIVSNNGIYISSKENISVYYTLGDDSHNNREMISLKGQRGLGTDFYIPMPASPVVTHTVADGGVGFDIVATQPGVTTVLITPKAASVGHLKNVTFAKTLTMGQTFSVNDNNSANPGELAGSIVSSDKPIAVTIKGSVRTTGSCTSYFTEQITPSNVLGKDYVVLKGNSVQDIAFILAPYNASSFTLSSASSTVNWLINSGETYSVGITDPITYVKSDKPVYLFHVSGYGCKLSGTQLAPVYCAGSYSTAFTRLTGDSLNINICTRSGFQSSFTFSSNGSSVPIPSSSFSIVPGSAGNLVAARLYLPTSSVSVGSYNELLNSADIFGVSVINGSYQGGSAYTQASDFAISAFARANVAPTTTICGNTQFTLNGVVGGGPITGQWNIIQGYGTLSQAINQLTNNVYTPSLLDTTNNSTSLPVNDRYVKIVLNSTGICPNATDTLRLHVKQPPIVSAGSNSFVCANNPTVQLSGNVYGATNMGVWTVLSPGSGSFTPGMNTFTPSYQLSLADTVLTQLYFVLTSTNNGGCLPVTDTVVVGINRPPIVHTGTVSPILRCSNSSTVFLNGTVSGTTTSTGIWQTNGSGVFLPNNVALSTNYVPSLSDISFGNVWLKLESTNNNLCTPVKDSLQVIFTEPSFANAGGDVNSCVNDPRARLQGFITGTVTNTGMWTGGSGSYSPSASVLNATYIATQSEVLQGSVTLTLTTTNNGICLGTSDQVKVNFQAKPLANFSVSTVCLGKYTEFTDQSINLSPSAVLKSWNWNFGDNTVPSLSLSPAHTYSTVGIFWARLIVRNTFNCPDTILKPVTVYELPTVDFSISRACSGSAQLISFTDQSTIGSPHSIPNTNHYWDFGGFGTSLAKDTAIVFPSEGFYSITHVVTSDKGCQAAASKSMNITPKPQANFVHINNSVPGLGANVSFRDTSLYALTWSWDFGNGETSNFKNPSTFYNQNGLYVVSLVVTDQFGCPNTYTTEIKISTIVSDIVKLIPNVITPNDDGKNDFWRLDFIDIFFPEAEIEIYNRWGVKLFRSVGYSNAWDGSYRGDPLPVGAYFYTINLHDKDQTPVIKGTVSLIK